jgi:hypothetical protein
MCSGFRSDYVNDDENASPPGLPQLFRTDCPGQKRLLTLVHAVPESFESAGTSVSNVIMYLIGIED